ncbi:MAG: hypothetical protein ACREMB_12780 [Candidatus Rokuibacteriota bacterium]
MGPLLRTIVLDSDATSRASVRRMLAGVPFVIVVGEFADLRDAVLQAPALRPDVLVVELPLGRDSQAGADGAAGSAAPIEQLTRVVPSTALLATGPTVSGEFVIRVIRAGAFEYLRRPVERSELLAALDKVARFRWGATPEQRAGRVVAVYSPKGLGVTTVATNMAVCLAESAPETVLLVDLDTRQSDVATFLNLRPSYSVLDAFGSIERMDEAYLRGLLVRHPSGLWVLPGPSRPERDAITDEEVRAGLEIIRSHFDHVVLDLRHELDPATTAALEAADVILFLVELNVSALRSAASGLATFRQLGLLLDRVRLVVMREDTVGEAVPLGRAREALGMPIHWKTPSDYPAIVASINSGRPVVTASPRSKIAKNLRQLTETIGKASGSDNGTSRRMGPLFRFVAPAREAEGVR